MNLNKRLRLAKEKFEAGKNAFNSLKYQEAVDNLLNAASLCKGIKHHELDYVACLVNAANSLQFLCRYEEVESLLEKAILVQKKILGSEHPDVMTVLNNLAVVYKHLGNYEQAQKLHEKILITREKTLGHEHPDIATSLMCIANIQVDQSNYEQAKQLCEKALTIRKKALGFEHPDVAAILNNLANIHEDQGDYEQAKKLHEQALSIREKSLGSEHHDVASSLNNLANIHKLQGDTEKATEYYQRAQAIINKVFDESHPITKKITKNYLELQQEVEELTKRDIEQRAALEEAKKLEYLSYMATGIAHNINNPVGIIRAAAQRGLMDIEQGISLNVEDGQEIFHSILDESERLHKIIKGFREFAKGDRKHRENVSLNNVVEQIKDYFQNQLESKNIVLKLELSTDNPCSYANFFILQEVLINLVHNAREILENTQNAIISIKTWQQAEKVGFTVEDNGTGIPTEQQKNLFMPFHSTKTHGMGLGLHFTHKSLLEINANITYQDCTPHGARFIIELPLAVGEIS